MNVDNYREGLRMAKQQILDNLPQIADEIAVSTLSVVKDRSINEGIIIKGQEGTQPNYSTNTFYTSSLKGKELNSGGRAYVAANKKGNWAGFRAAQGLPADKVNLSYTNRMWTGIQVIRTVNNGYGKYLSVVGAVDSETQKIVAGNVQRYGMFLDPTPEETQIAQEVAKERLMQIIQSHV